MSLEKGTEMCSNAKGPDKDESVSNTDSPGEPPKQSKAMQLWLKFLAKLGLRNH